MTQLNRISKSFALAAVPLALGIYWLLAHGAVANLDDQPVGYVAALEMSNYDISGGPTVLYRGDFYRGNWDGNLVAYDISESGSAAVKWQAKLQLASQHWDTGRKIFTVNGARGVPFRWNTTLTNATLNATQQTALGNTTQGPALLEFTRGNSANEGVKYRQRFSKIGDILHSRPYYFKHSNDVERVYIGANDGMLHAFDAVTGKEVFAYIPSMLIPKLSQYAVNPYSNHKYGVDGQLAIAKLTKGTTPLTLLAGGMGAGAIGIFALNVTDPAPSTEADAAGFAKWETSATSTGFGNLGHIYGAPKIVKLNNDEEVVLFPNGINSAGGKASLFVVEASTGRKLTEIVVDNAGPNNGLTGISAADLNGDGKVDVVYGGDLKGHVWKFDFKTASYPSSGIALFTPTTETARPIMAAPAISAHPEGGVMVNFGTGKLLEPADLTSTANEYLYGVRDSSNATKDTFAEPVLSTAATTTSPSRKYRAASTVTVNYAGGNKGWRITLSNGERVIGNHLLVDSGRFVLTTTQPDPSSAHHGNWHIEVDALTGSGPSRPFIDLDGNGTIDLTGNSDKVLAKTASGAETYVAPIGKFLGGGVWSQPILAKINRTFDQAYFNSNANNPLPPSTTTTTTEETPPSDGDRGVSGGHFDFDIYYNQCDPLDKKDYSKTCKANTHLHEYDDTYDVVGVNLLKASDSKLNLSNAVTSTSTKFKLLIANQKLSPAAQLTIGSVTKAVWDWPRSPGGFVASTPGGAPLSLTQANVDKLIISLPRNAFSNRKWVPDSDEVSSGLIATQTACVRSNQGANGAATGPWMNGALTLQVVKDSTTDAAVELNQSGNPSQGYRLKKDATSQANQFAQYTIFWHHPNNRCYGDGGWTSTPASDTTASKDVAKKPAVGSADPKGSFESSSGSPSGGGSGGSGGSSTTNGTDVTLGYNPLEGSYTPSGGGNDTASGSTVITTGGSTCIPTLTNPCENCLDAVRAATSEACQCPKPYLICREGNPPRLGRLSWQELLR